MQKVNRLNVAARSGSTRVASERPCASSCRREPTPLLIGKAEAPTQLLLQDAVLLLEVVEDSLLLLVQPARQQRDEEDLRRHACAHPKDRSETLSRLQQSSRLSFCTLTARARARSTRDVIRWAVRLRRGQSALKDYDVAPDGRFVMVRPEEGEGAVHRLNVILNSFQELERLVPTDK